MTRKLIISGIVCLLMAGHVLALTFSARISHTVVAADNNSNIRDTVYSGTVDLASYDFQRFWLAGHLSDVDTGWGGDTVYIQLQDAVSGNGPWASFYDTALVFSGVGGKDTLKEFGTKIAWDSTVRINNVLRVRYINGFTLGAGDTAGILGQTYNLNAHFYLSPTKK